MAGHPKVTRSILRKRWYFVLLIALIAVVGYAAIVVFPDTLIFGIYVVPILAAAMLASIDVVYATIAACLGLMAISLFVGRPTLDLAAIRVLFLGTNAALAVLIARRQEIAETRGRELEALVEAARGMLQDQPLPDLAEIIAEQALQILGAPAVAFWEADPAGQSWRLIAAHGLAAGVTRAVQEVPGSFAPVLARAAQHDDLVEVYDLESLSQEDKLAQLISERAGLRSALIQPLRVDHLAVGVIFYLYPQARRFTARERRLISPIGSLWALAVERARLAEVARARTRDAEEARQNLQQFLGMVAHDLRGPLTVILGNVQLVARRGSPLGEPERQSLRMAENAAHQMRRLVTDLLDAARIGAGQFTLAREQTNLAAIALQVVEEWQVLTPDRQIQLVAPASLECYCDPHRIQQLLTNLLTNAIKYSPEERTILVELAQRGEVAQLSVSDQGSGIPPEDLDRLFRAFSRIGSNPNVAGIGLGLYIARGIVEAHRGEIGVESKAGETTFWVTLPLAPD